MSIRLIAFSRLVVIMGLAVWLTLAVTNNLTDPDTNRLLLGHTLSMGLLIDEDVLGAGLRWRAVSSDLSNGLLYLIAAVQILVSVFLWRAAITYTRAFLLSDEPTLIRARNQSLLALSLFVGLWMWFICGGLWFGYWLKQGPVQIVHLLLIVIGLGALSFVQSQPAALPSMPIRTMKPASSAEGPPAANCSVPDETIASPASFAANNAQLTTSTTANWSQAEDFRAVPCTSTVL